MFLMNNWLSVVAANEFSLEFSLESGEQQNGCINVYISPCHVSTRKTSHYLQSICVQQRELHVVVTHFITKCKFPTSTQAQLPTINYSTRTKIRSCALNLYQNQSCSAKKWEMLC